MKMVIRLLTMFLVLIAWYSTSLAEIALTNELSKDIIRAYGFYLGQEYSLNEISKKYPSLSGLSLIAEKEFSSTFKSSIEGMDEIMLKHDKDEWKKIKNQFNKQIASYINIDKLDKSEAHEFLKLVRQRAKGNIKPPIIKTLLLFKSGYEKNPEREFIDGYKYKYTSNGAGKAKGIEFSIEYPKTWLADEGHRPNIVQKFVSQNGKGHEMLLVLIKDIPLQPGEKITEKDVSEILNPNDIKAFIPSGSTYINSGKLTLENLPGLWVHFKVNMSRVRNTIGMETIAYMIFYKNKMIQIQGHVVTAINGKKNEHGGLKKYEKLFDLMANSFVIISMYKS